jgi:hypothetical protein
VWLVSGHLVLLGCWLAALPGLGQWVVGPGVGAAHGDNVGRGDVPQVGVGGAQPLMAQRLLDQVDPAWAMSAP